MFRLTVSSHQAPESKLPSEELCVKVVDARGKALPSTGFDLEDDGEEDDEDGLWDFVSCCVSGGYVLVTGSDVTP